MASISSVQDLVRSVELGDKGVEEQLSALTLNDLVSLERLPLLKQLQNAGLRWVNGSSWPMALCVQRERDASSSSRAHQQAHQRFPLILLLLRRRQLAQ